MTQSIRSVIPQPMKTVHRMFRVTTRAAFSALSPLFLLAAASASHAAEFPTPKEGEWIAPEFQFHTKETLANMRLRFTTVGDPTGEPVLILHGTGGSAKVMLSSQFAGELFGPGQVLDARKYYIILPDAVGAGGSAKPSDGLRTKFPRYNYDDMVLAQYRLVTEGLGVRHLRAVIGFSMGGMHTWLWGTKYPGFMDALVPMASQPTEMSGRNWMTRRMLTESIRNDPAWNGGNYTSQPPALRAMNVFFNLTTNGGSQAYYKAAPTRESADKLLADRMAASFATDANDYLYQWEASGDYNASPGLERIEAAVLAINSADDERNPPELGIMEREMKRLKNARLHLIPGSEETRGHGTVAIAKFWAPELRKLLDATPKKLP